MSFDTLATDSPPGLLPEHGTVSLGAEPSGFGPTLAIDSTDGWLRWSRFSYELPPDHAGRRRTLWRQLRQIRALKLLPGEWAMAHDEHDDPGLDRLVTAVREAGGSATVREVGRSGIDEVELQVRLCRSCESLWDPFFNGADRVARARGPKLSVDDVDRLRRRFADELPGDVMLSDAASRAAHRVDDLAGEVLARVKGDTPLHATPTRLDLVSAWALDNGAVRYIGEVQPFPSLLLERAFNEFEATVFQPSAQRIPLRHGVFVFTALPAARDTTLELLRQRLATFATYQG
jgi:hypothetical protein